MHALLDLVFPPRCAGCDRPGSLLCEACAADVRRIDPGAACARCGAPITAATAGCAECRGRTFAFDSVRAATLLEPPISRAVVLLKDGGERRYAGVLAALVAECAHGWSGPDCTLVPVPASPAAVRRRGFDHAVDLTRALGELAGMPVSRLLDASPAADQRSLGRQERFANRAGAFRLARPRGWEPEAEVPARIILVDDVLTTGATLDAAACALRGAGVAEVRGLVVARAMRTDT